MQKRWQDYYYLKMDEIYLTVPYYNEQRRVRILLPQDYVTNTDKFYPVLYMLDGQNIFYSREAFSGHSWKLIPTIKRNKDLPQMIVVGIDNAGGNRMNEYSPWKIVDSPLPEDLNLGGMGMEHGEWIVNTVKPYIDNTYRTKSEPEYTALAGSSMGGNMTAYMGAAYPYIFGNLGVFSLATWITDQQFKAFLAKTEVNPEQKIYIQVGAEEGDDADRQLMFGNMKQNYIDCSLNYAEQLLLKGHRPENIRLRVFANEKHTELAWAKHFPEYLRFISDLI